MPRLFDDSLYGGAAEHYLHGRMPYPRRLVDAIVEHAPLTPSTRLLDLGCGPGSLTLPLAPHCRYVVGVDADADMLRVAAREAGRQRVTNAEWILSPAEDLDLADGEFDVIVLAQSFHWMDRPAVATMIRRALDPGGVCCFVGATTHTGDLDATNLPHPAPPRERIDALVRRYLGPQRRAGQQTLPAGDTASGEDEIFRAAGFGDPVDVTVPCGELMTRTVDHVLDARLSLSSSAPHLFGDRFAPFVDELHALLIDESDNGLFSERLGDMRLALWRA